MEPKLYERVNQIRKEILIEKRQYRISKKKPEESNKTEGQPLPPQLTNKDKHVQQELESEGSFTDDDSLHGFTVST